MRVVSVLIVVLVLALSACNSMRQNPGLLSQWKTTTLSQVEMREAKAAVAEVAGTSVFDWNTVSAQRSGKLLHVWLDALPEPQNDGTNIEPVVHCLGLPVELDCKVHARRSMYIPTGAGSRQRVVLLFGEEFEVREVVAFAEQTLRVAGSLTREQECGGPISDDRMVVELQEAFVTGTGELQLLFGRRGSETDVSAPSRRPMPAGRSRSFILKFERSDGSDNPVFSCWEVGEVMVTA